MTKLSLRPLLLALLLTCTAQAASIKYILTFNGVGVTIFPSTLSGDSMSMTTTQYLDHFNASQAVGTTNVATQPQLNLNAGPNANATRTLNFNQSVTLTSLVGATLSSSSTQTLAWSIQDAVTGSSHVFTVNFPSVTFTFNDGTFLTVKATSPSALTLGSTSQNSSNVTYDVTYGAAVPEPATTFGVGLGLVTLGLARRLRK